MSGRVANMKPAGSGGILGVVDYFGENVFSIRTMRGYLSEETYKSLVATIREGQRLDPGIADEVADAMRTWAMEKASRTSRIGSSR